MRRRPTDLLILFLAIAAGFYVSGAVFYLCTYLHWLPALPPGSAVARIFLAKFQLAQIFWSCGSSLGLGGFLARQRKSRDWIVPIGTAVGFYILGALFYAGVYFGWLSADPGNVFVMTFTPFLWIAGTLIGTGGVLARWREVRYWLIVSPFILPLLYTALLFVYFNFLPKG